MNINMEGIIKGPNKSKETASSAVERTVGNDRFLFQKEFEDFINASQELDAQKTIINGKPREYVSVSALAQKYIEILKDHGVWKSTIQYRIENLQPDEFPDDLNIKEDAQHRQSKYFINRLNTALIAKIFMPPTTKDEEIQKLINDVNDMEDHQAFLQTFKREHGEDDSED